MTIPIFDPKIAPSPGSRRSPEIKLRKAEFGDGYTQSSPAGLNHIKRKITYTWEAIDLETYRYLETFFRERGGCKPFYYEPFGIDEFEGPVKWVCEEWSGSSSAPWSFTATFIETFSNSA